MDARPRPLPNPTDGVFAALADPTRRRIVRELAAQGPLTPTALGARAGVSRQAAAKHLAVLETAGLARGRRIGREVRYHLDTGPFAEAESWMRSIGDAWDRRQAMLRRLADAAGGGEEE
jgi:DNA-binding transcriptional ArsR family regulator